jgi:type IV pilus assembly protein PilE
MHSSRPCNGARARGFTLVEMMIAVSIVAILAAVAYPSYMNQVQRTRRTDGKSALMDTAQRLERCHTRFGRYDSDDCEVELPFDSAEAFYSVDAVEITASTFTLSATPQNQQADDSTCGILHLTSAGQQGSGDADSDSNHCW